MTQPAVPTYVILTGSTVENYRGIAYLGSDRQAAMDKVAGLFVRAADGETTHVSAHADGEAVMTLDVLPDESDDRIAESILELFEYIETHPKMRGVVLDNMEDAMNDLIQISMVR
jgi:hypothetical protein